MNKLSSLGGQLYPGQVGVIAEQKGANSPSQTDCLSLSQQRSPKAPGGTEIAPGQGASMAEAMRV